MGTPPAWTWSRAHNASIAVAYLEHHSRTGKESAAERFFVKDELVRVLYAHVLVA